MQIKTKNLTYATHTDVEEKTRKMRKKFARNKIKKRLG